MGFEVWNALCITVSEPDIDEGDECVFAAGVLSGNDGIDFIMAIPQKRRTGVKTGSERDKASFGFFLLSFFLAYAFTEKVFAISLSMGTVQPRIDGCF